jgi:hypothetical protein
MDRFREACEMGALHPIVRDECRPSGCGGSLPRASNAMACMCNKQKVSGLC